MKSVIRIIPVVFMKSKKNIKHCLRSQKRRLNMLRSPQARDQRR